MGSREGTLNICLHTEGNYPAKRVELMIIMMRRRRRKEGA